VREAAVGDLRLDHHRQDRHGARAGRQLALLEERDEAGVAPRARARHASDLELRQRVLGGRLGRALELQRLDASHGRAGVGAEVAPDLDEAGCVTRAVLATDAAGEGGEAAERGEAEERERALVAMGAEAGGGADGTDAGGAEHHGAHPAEAEMLGPSWV
jgi:hypothetical protein